MQRRLVLEFTKMNGAGNDFVIIDNRFYAFSDDELRALAVRLCTRRTGVGADGLLAFAASTDERHDFRMLYFNADGSRATMCGNGARCLARFARQAGLNKDDLVFLTDAGSYRAHVPDDPQAGVRLFVPSFNDYKASVDLTAAPAGWDAPVSYVWTGTEHLVVAADQAAQSFEDVAPVLREDPILGTAGANVNWVSVKDRGVGKDATLVVRTFEKGVEAETLACGTGALASAVVAHLNDWVAAERVQVIMPGGTLVVGGDIQATHADGLYLEGPAEQVYRGTLEV